MSPSLLCRVKNSDAYLHRWATDEDAVMARRDEMLFGNVFARRDEDGLLHRIDPSAVTVHDGDEANQ